MIRKRITFILFLLFSLPLLAQDADYKALLQLVGNTAQFNKLCPQEKVFIHFDNTAYFQGDVIWFSASVVDASTGCPAVSRVLYVDLLSPTGTLLRQLKLKVTDGRCHGSLPLIDTSVEEARQLRGAISYPSGFYEVRAYTLNMLNFDEAGIFSRVLPVYQQPEQEGHWDDAVLNASMAAWTNSDRPKTKDEKDVNVSFFPEGGSLVKGVPCRIAFKAVDNRGEGIPVVGVVKDEAGEGDDLALIATAWDGMGSFLFTPTRRRHTVRITYQGKNYSFALPEAQDQGFALRVDNLASDFVAGTLDTPMRNGKSQDKLTNHLVGLTLTSNGHTCRFDTLRFQPATLDDGTAILRAPFLFSKEGLPTGVCQLTFFTTEGEVLAQRMLFVNNGVVRGNVEVSTDKPAYSPYAPVEVTLHATDAAGAPLSTSLSVAVRDAADMGTAVASSLFTDMLLSSELKGCINHPEWYFQSADRQHVQALDLLMMTQGWTRWNWRQMACVEPFTIQHYVEDRLVLDGTLLTRMQGKPLPNATVTMKLYSPDRQERQESTIVTDENGRFGFAVEDFEGKWDMFLSARHKEQPVDARMRLDRSARPEVRPYESFELLLPDHETVTLDDVPVVPAANTFGQDPDSVIHLEEVQIDGKRKYIDYMTFKAFDAEEDTEHQLDCGRFTYKVRDYLREKGYDLDDNAFIDYSMKGDTVNDRDQFIEQSLGLCLLNNRRVLWYLHDEHRNLATSAYTPGFDMDMEDIKSIIVYDSPTIFESMPIVRETLTQEMIQSLRTRATINGTPVPAGLYVIDVTMYPTTQRRSHVKGTRQTSFRGYSEVADFYSPTYPDGPIAGDKDYRRTLYWNPDVRTGDDGNASISFYTNSTTRPFTISAQGITSTGLPVER